MVKKGIKFFVTANGVWLTDEVAPEFLSVSTT
jgi:RNA:NAD 2'-phosphotransferase (TPT1/KptA family)